MTTQGIIVLSIIGVLYLAWIVELVRRGRLHASYGSIWVLWIVVGVLVVAFQPMLDFVTRLVGAQFPASALSVLAFAMLFAMQIYILSQLTILGRRVTLIAQHIAIDEAAPGQPDPAAASQNPPQAG